MRVRVLKPGYRLEFDGSPAIWNELLRPLFGGPEAPPDPVPAAPAAEPVRAAGPTASSPATPGSPTQPPATAPAPAVAAPAAPPPPAPIVRTFAPPELPAAPPQPAGGPPASQGAAPSSRPAVRTWFPPRDDRGAVSHGGPPQRDDRRGPGRDDRGPRRDDRNGRGEGRPADAPWRRRGGPEPEIQVEPSNDPAVLYGRLREMGSRRADRDAVLAAVWFVGQDQREVHEREAEQHLRDHGGPEDVKVRPTVAKHITRTKLLEAGTQPGLVRLSRKGREQIRLLCGA